MANWEYAIITAKGKSLQAKLIAGTTLSITRVVSGAGYVSPVLLERQTEVTDPKQTLDVKGVIYPDEGKCALRTYLTNEGLTTEYTARQIGVYATDPDEGEILYFISQVGSQDQGSFVPAESSLTASFSAEWTFYFQYGQADEVSVTVDPALAVSHEELEEALESKADLEGGKIPVEQIPVLDYVPLTRTINGKDLSDDIMLDAEDVGAEAVGTVDGLRLQIVRGVVPIQMETGEGEQILDSGGNAIDAYRTFL